MSKTRRTVPATLATFTDAYVATITPDTFEYWCESLCTDESERMRDTFHRLVQQQVRKARPRGADDLRRRVREALPPALHAEMQAFDDYLDAHQTAREDTLFQIGIQIGRVLGGGAR